MRRSGIVLVMIAALSLVAAKQSFPPQATPEAFAQWQTAQRAFLEDVIYNGPQPEASALDPSYGARDQRSDYELIEVSFHDRPGHLTTGWLARPLKPRAKRLPAVISLHGHEGSALATFDPNNMYFYGDLLASRGYVVLALNIEHEYLEGVNPVWIHFRPLPTKVAFPPTGQRVWMVKRAIDFLAAEPGVDPDKIAIVGLSNGGFTALMAAAVDERIQLCVASGSLILHDRMWHRELIHCRCQYLYRMDGELDYFDVAALVAPRALVLQNGERDPIFPIESAREAYVLVEQAYALAGAADKVTHDVHDGAHEFRSEVPLQWFDQFLPLP